MASFGDAASVVSFSGGREMVNQSRAKELIDELTVESPTHLRLSNKSFDTGAATVIAEYLDRLSDLSVVDISDIIAGRPEDEALEVIRIISSSLKKFPITELDVSDNAFGAKGLEACMDLLMGAHLQKLWVCNNGLSAEAVVVLVHYLMTGAGETAGIKLLHVYNNMAGTAGAESFSELLRQCPDLEDLRFSATRSHCGSIAEAMCAMNGCIKKLDLADNNFSGVAGHQLAQALGCHTGLEVINLRDDSLDSEAVMECVKAIPESVIVLDISGNELDIDSVDAIAENISRLSALESLFIDDCELGSECARSIAQAVKMLPRLKTLSLTTCEINGSGAYHIAKAVAGIASFQCLELNGNQLSAEALGEVQSVLENAGKKLGEMDDNDEDDDDENLAETIAEYK